MQITKINNKYFIILFLTGALLLAWNNMFQYFWFDESYTLNIIKRSFYDIWDLTSRDVHPPLYYWMLKIFSFPFGYSVASARFFSLLPVLLMLLAGCTTMRRMLSDKAAFYFMLLVILMPITLYIVSEIRMYSWVMFWVFLTALYAYKSYIHFDKQNIVLLLLFSLCAAYTHNYGLISVFYIYVILFAVLMVKRRKCGYLFVGVGAMFSIIYLPWLINLLQQVNSVKEDYWIAPLSIHNIVDYLTYIVRIDTTNMEAVIPQTVIMVKPVLYALFFIFFITLFIKGLFFSKAENEQKLDSKPVIVLSLVAFLLPILTGIVVSFLVRPFFISRYMICCLPLLLVSIAVCMSGIRLSERGSKFLIYGFFSVLSALCIINFYLTKVSNNEKERVRIGFVEYVKNNMDNKSAFLYNFEGFFPLGIYSVYFPESDHYVYLESDSLTNMQKSILENTPHIQLKDYNDIPLEHDKVFVVEGTFFLSRDSARICENYVISDRLDLGLWRRSVYKLERKPLE